MKFPELPQALCKEMDPELYWLEGGGGASSENELARKLCFTCPEQVACLEWAVHHEDQGLWGGTYPNEREQIRYRRGIQIERISIFDFMPRAS